jgi:hypothetical protein
VLPISRPSVETPQSWSHSFVPIQLYDELCAWDGIFVRFGIEPSSALSAMRSTKFAVASPTTTSWMRLAILVVMEVGSTNQAYLLGYR